MIHGFYVLVGDRALMSREKSLPRIRKGECLRWMRCFYVLEICNNVSYRSYTSSVTFGDSFPSRGSLWLH